MWQDREYSYFQEPFRFMSLFLNLPLGTPPLPWDHLRLLLPRAEWRRRRRLPRVLPAQPRPVLGGSEARRRARIPRRPVPVARHRLPRMQGLRDKIHAQEGVRPGQEGLWHAVRVSGVSRIRRWVALLQVLRHGRLKGWRGTAGREALSQVQAILPVQWKIIDGSTRGNKVSSNVYLPAVPADYTLYYTLQETERGTRSRANIVTTVCLPCFKTGLPVSLGVLVAGAHVPLGKTNSVVIRYISIMSNMWETFPNHTFCLRVSLSPRVYLRLAVTESLGASVLQILQRKIFGGGDCVLANSSPIFVAKSIYPPPSRNFSLTLLSGELKGRWRVANLYLKMTSFLWQ